MMKKRAVSQQAELSEKYEKSGRKKVALILVCTVTLLFLGVFFMTLGVKDTNMKQVCQAIYQGITKKLYLVEDGESAARKVVFLIRFPGWFCQFSLASDFPYPVSQCRELPAIPWSARLP